MSKNLAYFMFAAALSTLDAAGQSTVHIATDASEQNTTGISELAEVLPRLDRARLAPVVKGSWEGEVLESGEEAADNSLLLKLNERPSRGLYTLRTGTGDVLVANWGPSAARETDEGVWLWDSPYFTVILVSTRYARSSLAAYCEELFRWNAGPVAPSGLTLSFPKFESGSLRVWGSLQHLETPYNRVWLEGISDARGSWIGVGFSKSLFFSEYPREAADVPERFPPLREILTGRTRISLFEELGKGYPSQSLKGVRRQVGYPRNRDEIIDRELLSRGPLTEAELRQIVIGPFDTGTYGDALLINDRIAPFLDAVSSRHELGTYAPLLQHILLNTPISATAQDTVISNVFRAARNGKVDLLRTALSFVQSGKFVGASISYVGSEAADGETLRVLSLVGVSPEFEDLRAGAIARIKSRIAGK